MDLTDRLRGVMGEGVCGVCVWVDARARHTSAAPVVAEVLLGVLEQVHPALIAH